MFQIDTRMAGYAGITAGYLIRGDRPCLVETGTAPSAPVVRDALAALGIGPGDLATVVVTHIHLDHAGGAGDIAADVPGGRDRRAPAGRAGTCADPSRLMAGARMVYGRALERLFGVLAPVPADRIVALDDTGTVDLGGGRRLDSHYSPGHARHHVGLVDSDTGDLYVGDTAGVYLPDTGDVRPATPPPDFDMATALASIRKFAALRPARLMFSHYGPVSQVSETLDRSAEEINVWVEEDPAGTHRGLGPRPRRRHGVGPHHGPVRGDRRIPIPLWRRGWSGSAAPAATWKASCSGSTRPSRPPANLPRPAAASSGVEPDEVRSDQEISTEPGWEAVDPVPGLFFAAFFFVGVFSVGDALVGAVAFRVVVLVIVLLEIHVLEVVVLVAVIQVSVIRAFAFEIAVL